MPRNDYVTEWPGNLKFYSQKMIELAAAGNLDEDDLSPYWKAIVSNNRIQSYLGEMETKITGGDTVYQLCPDRTGGLSITLEARFFQSLSGFNVEEFYMRLICIYYQTSARFLSVSPKKQGSILRICPISCSC